MSRSLARELGMQLIFQMDAQKDFGIGIKERFLDSGNVSSVDREYLNELYDKLTENLPEVDEMINKCSTGWSASRMAKVDLAIARLAITEIIYINNIPVPVAINEAVEMAKKYGGDHSPVFLNGLLGKVARANDEKRFENGQ